MLVAALYIFATCYTAGFTLELEVITQISLANTTRISPSSPSYDPFFQGRVKKQQAEGNSTRGGYRLFRNTWDEEGSCFLHFVTIFLAAFIVLGLTTFIICYSYG